MPPQGLLLKEPELFSHPILRCPLLQLQAATRTFLQEPEVLHPILPFCCCLPQCDCRVEVKVKWLLLKQAEVLLSRLLRYHGGGGG